MPKNAYLTGFKSEKSRSKTAISEMMINEGSTTPSVAHALPKTPPTRNPTKVAELMAMGPGVDSAMARISKISSSEIQPCFSTVSRWISGIIA